MDFVNVRNISIGDITVEVSEVSVNKPENENFSTRLGIKILSLKPVLSLYVGVGARTIESVELIPITAPGTPFRDKNGSERGYAWATRLPAFGEYWLDILSNEREFLNLEYRIDD